MTPIARFAQKADCPEPWFKHGLLPDGLFAFMAAEFERQYGSAKPEGDTEHWRYGAFLQWFRTKPDAQKMAQLLEAALADPDWPMGGTVVKERIANPLCTQQMLATATAQCAANRDHCVNPEHLKLIFRSGNAQYKPPRKRKL